MDVKTDVTAQQRAGLSQTGGEQIQKTKQESLLKIEIKLGNFAYEKGF